MQGSGKSTTTIQSEATNVGMDQEATPTFESELRALINRFSKENGSDTPDFILAEYMNSCLTAFNVAVTKRVNWYGGVPSFSKQKLQALPVNPTAPTKEN